MTDRLAFGVKARGRLVEQQQRRGGQQRAGQGDAAALAGRQARAALAEDPVEGDVVERGLPRGGGHRRRRARRASRA